VILGLLIGKLNYYVISNYKLWGDVGVSNWLEMRTWNLFRMQQTEDSRSWVAE